MHGPYTAVIEINRSGRLVLEQDELREGSLDAERFYRDASPGLAEGALRCAVFCVAKLLDPGDEASVQIVGREGSGKSEREQEWKGASARREPDGRFLSSLGSRFGERVFVGV